MLTCTTGDGLVVVRGADERGAVLVLSTNGVGFEIQRPDESMAE